MTDKVQIAVVGHLVSDEISYFGGEMVSALGGISYNLAALLSIQKSGKIIPVCELGFDIEDLFNEYFGRHALVDRSAIRKTALPNVVNRLVYDVYGNRDEWNSRVPERLSLDVINNETDTVLLNFISGDDLRLDDLREFKSRFNGIILCDYHSLALGRGGDGKRYYRKHPEWDGYLSNADIVQMNVAELATISGAEGLSFGNIITVCHLIHTLGPEICIITMGRNGTVFSMDRGGAAYHIPPIVIENEVDPTGCGDTFAAVFLYNYVSTKDPLESASVANRYAAAKATFAGLDGFREIGAVLEKIGAGTEPVKLK